MLLVENARWIQATSGPSRWIREPLLWPIAVKQLTHKSISSLSDCLTDISLWMKSSKLKLNSNKTEFIIIGTKQQRHKLSNHFPVKLLDNDISPSDSVRNLGVIFDSDFSFHKHISNIYASHAFTTYVISAEFGVTYLYPLLRQYQIL